MAYFDPSKETEVVTDASPFGLSTILIEMLLMSAELCLK